MTNSLPVEQIGGLKRSIEMARSLRIEFPGACYHVMARGNEQRAIYRDELDMNEFLRLTGISASRHGFQIHAYVLMPNHYHFLLESTSGQLSRGMHSVNGLYSQYFNDRHQRVGHLFQGRFKALLIDKNNYWMAVSRYIHQNPASAGFVKFPWDYPWSSCKNYLGLAPPPQWLKLARTLGYFSDTDDHIAAFRRFLQAKQEEDPWNGATGQTLFGSDEFIRSMRQEAKSKTLGARGIAYRNDLTGHLSADVILSAVNLHFSHSNERFFRFWKNSPEKMTAMLLIRENAGLKSNEIGIIFGMKPEAVTQALKRFRRSMSQDTRLTESIRILTQKLSQN